MLLLLVALLLQEGSPREHHVAPAAIQLDDLGPDRLAQHGAEVLDRAQIHLGAGKERLHPDVDGQASLHDLDDPAFDGRAAFVGAGDGVPDFDLVGLVLGEDDQALGVFLGLEIDLDLVADPRQRAARWNSSMGMAPSLL